MTNEELTKIARKYASSLAEGAQKNIVLAAYMDGARMMAAHLGETIGKEEWHLAGIKAHEEIDELLKGGEQ